MGRKQACLVVAALQPGVAFVCWEGGEVSHTVLQVPRQ